MKAFRLNSQCQGWRGQKYMRKLAARTRRRMEREAIRIEEYDTFIPKVCARFSVW